MCVICVARVCSRSCHTNVAYPPFHARFSSPKDATQDRTGTGNRNRQNRFVGDQHWKSTRRNRLSGTETGTRMVPTHRHFPDGPCGTIVPGTNPHPSQGQTGQNGHFMWNSREKGRFVPGTLSQGFAPSRGHSSIWRAQDTADFCIKPKIFAENRRKPQIGLRHLSSVTFSSAPHVIFLD